jgi:hypothetical protein
LILIRPCPERGAARLVLPQPLESVCGGGGDHDDDNEQEMVGVVEKMEERFIYVTFSRMGYAWEGEGWWERVGLCGEELYRPFNE